MTIRQRFIWIFAASILVANLQADDLNKNEIKESVQDLSQALTGYDKEVMSQMNQSTVPNEDLVRSRMAILRSWGDDSPITSFSTNKDLLSVLKDQLKQIREKKKEKTPINDSLTLKDLTELFNHRASGDAPQLYLSSSQLVNLATILELENERRANGDKKKVPSDEELLRDIAKRELRILSADSSEKTPKLPDNVRKALEKAYLEKNPDEAKEIEKHGLSAKQIEKLLEKPNILKPSDLLSWIGDMAEKNHSSQGNEYHWGLAGDLYRNLNVKNKIKNPNAPIPPTLDKVREYFATQVNPKQGDTTPPPNGSRRKIQDLGQGPSIGSTKGSPSHNGFNQSQPGRHNDKLPPPTNQPANLSSDDLACLNLLRKTKHTTEFAVTFKNDSGTFHCGLTFASKDPKWMKAHPEPVPGKKGACFADAITAKHCLYHGPISGMSVAGVPEILGYDMDLQSQSEPISGDGDGKGDDGAHLALAIPCKDIPSLHVEQVITPTDFNNLQQTYRDGFPAFLGRNCKINEDPNGPNHCGLFAKGDFQEGNAAFASFNSNVGGGYNHGKSTEQGDSGSSFMTCVKKGDHLEPRLAGAISYVHSFPGFEGGAASGTFVNYLDNVLPNPRKSQVNPDEENPRPREEHASLN